MGPHSIPKQAFGFFAEDMDGETLLYRLGAHKAIHLNETAAVIWKLCDGTRTVLGIVEVLREAFPEAGGELVADIQEALSMLAAEGAVIEAAAGGPPAAGGA